MPGRIRVAGLRIAHDECNGNNVVECHKLLEGLFALHETASACGEYRAILFDNRFEVLNVAGKPFWSYSEYRGAITDSMMSSLSDCRCQ